MSCPWCNWKRAKFFSVYGREKDGYTVANKYISCADCKPKLTSECSSGPVKILPLDLSIIDREFRNAIDRKQMKEFIKNVLGI